jgi:hypothetical protein
MPRPMNLGRFAVTGLAALALAATSCGKFVREERLPETGATLEGTVKYGDENVEFAMIQVLAANGSATGRVGPDGRYKVENAPVGEVKVGVNTMAARGDFQSKVMAAGASKGPAPKFVEVPAKYADPEASGLATTVKSGSNTYDIVIPK